MDRELIVPTHAGKLVNINDPKPADICIEDIVHALALTNRFNGHTVQPISVLTHSLVVSQLCPSEVKLWGLLHDSAEAYIGDVSFPIKQTVPEFSALEERFLQVAICPRFRLPYPMPEIVRKIDRMVAASEYRLFFLHQHQRERDLHEEPVDSVMVEHYAFTIEESRSIFMQVFNRLFSGAEVKVKLGHAG